MNGRSRPDRLGAQPGRLGHVQLGQFGHVERRRGLGVALPHRGYCRWSTRIARGEHGQPETPLVPHAEERPHHVVEPAQLPQGDQSAPVGRMLPGPRADAGEGDPAPRGRVRCRHDESPIAAPWVLRVVPLAAVPPSALPVAALASCRSRWRTSMPPLNRCEGSTGPSRAAASARHPPAGPRGSAVSSAAKCARSPACQRRSSGRISGPSRATARASRSEAGAVTNTARVSSGRTTARAALTPSNTSTGATGTGTGRGRKHCRTQLYRR